MMHGQKNIKIPGGCHANLKKNEKISVL